MEATDIPAIFLQLIHDIQNEIPETGFSQNDLIAKSLARSGAVKNGSSLALEQQAFMVRKLFLCKEPGISPYGKKTMVTLSRNELDNKVS